MTPEHEALRVPDDDMVICPGCVHQFRAIPVNVQAELRELSQRASEAEAGRVIAEELICKVCGERDALREANLTQHSMVKTLQSAVGAARAERDRAVEVADAATKGVYSKYMLEAADAIADARHTRAELAAAKRDAERWLADIYAADPLYDKSARAVVADLCDEKWDRSGALLGRVRDAAQAKGAPGE